MLDLLIELVTCDYLLAWNHSLLGYVEGATLLGDRESLALVVDILILSLQGFLLL